MALVATVSQQPYFGRFLALFSIDFLIFSLEFGSGNWYGCEEERKIKSLQVMVSKLVAGRRRNWSLNSAVRGARERDEKNWVFKN